MNRESLPAVISAVRPGSLADVAGIAAGDALVAVNGRVMRDVVDFQFHAAEHEVEVLFRKTDGSDDLVLFEKEIDDDIGLEFERATWDDVTLCNNNCFFCFLKGLPKGMRKSLYMKDDDYRLSFLHGNFVTLTNLTEDDWVRLEEQRLSPLNVSVHATELGLRRKMLGNTDAPDILEQLRRLATLGIAAHTQIVLCPGVNDGKHLDRSIRDLAALHPTVQTISVVPVGASPKLEDWSLSRDGIELVRPTPEYARTIVEQVGPLQKECRQRHGRTIVQCSDEYYVTAGVPVPPASTYDGFPQYENGIGMVRTMLEDWRRTARRIRSQTDRQSQRERSSQRERQRVGNGDSAPTVPALLDTARGKHVVIGCATLIAPTLACIASELGGLLGARIDVIPVTNTVFGERVNVSGLLCGQDYIRDLAGREPDCFILPRPSLDYFGKQFLDSMTVEEVEIALGAPLTFATQWSEVVDILARGPRKPARNEHSNGAFWSEERASLPAGAAWVST